MAKPDAHRKDPPDWFLILAYVAAFAAVLADSIIWRP